MDNVTFTLDNTTKKFELTMAAIAAINAHKQGSETAANLIIDGIAAISGIFCVVLCAKGKKGQYIWGLLNVVGYVIIAWINKYYGRA